MMKRILMAAVLAVSAVAIARPDGGTLDAPMDTTDSTGTTGTRDGMKTPQKREAPKTTTPTPAPEPKEPQEQEQ